MPNDTSTSQPTGQPLAVELMRLFANGVAAQAEARILTLSQADYIDILRTVQRLDTVLADYALSWKNSEYWGRGTPYPDEAKAKAA